MSQRRAPQASKPLAKTPGRAASSNRPLLSKQMTFRDVVLAGGLSRLTVKEMFQ